MMKQMGKALCAMVLVSCGSAPATMPVAEYNVMTISTTDCELQTNYSAAIRGCQSVDVYPQVSGTLTKLCVSEGQKVKKGQSLFVIDQVPYLAALRTAEANVAAAKAGVATAQLNADSRKELYKENVVSEFDMKTAQNTLLTAKAQLAQAEAALVNARNNLTYTEVKSPVTGVVGNLPFRQGTLVGPSMPKALTTVADNSMMYVYFSMSESQMLQLIRKFGSKDKALEEMPAVRLLLNDGSTYAEEGKIETISGVVDPNSGTVGMRAVFPNENGLLVSGGNGMIVVPNKRTDCIVIPQGATFEAQDRVFVYKIVDGKASASPVVVTRTTDGRSYVVESGLNVGDVIVAEGAGLLREGTPIKAKESQPATSAPQAAQ
ncbi:MAG: efflux RND transporter periplasmic adaptor subunit [Bacteroidales bacterium]|nr:efflux RND transporter periplasmic adaptor subunit [Bacteroidales bacterium]